VPLTPSSLARSALAARGTSPQLPLQMLHCPVLLLILTCFAVVSTRCVSSKGNRGMTTMPKTLTKKARFLHEKIRTYRGQRKVADDKTRADREMF